VTKRAKQIDNRIQSSGRVVRAATTHREQIADKLAARAVEVQGPTTKATKDAFLTLVDFLADSLKHGAGRLDAAELDLAAERADDVGVRERRDAAEADLRNRAVRVRSNVVDALGAPALKTYGLEGATPRAPRDLTSHARNVANLMRGKPFSIAADGVSFDSAGIASMLDAKAGELEAVIAEMEREEQELADKLGKRDGAVEQWTDEYQGVADALTGLLRLTGRKDLSERVRPTSRTISGEEIAAPVEEPVADGGG
jgi:hypothetical protein